MTPLEIVDYVRRVTNTTGDTTYISNQEIIESYLYDACLQISELVPCIETRNTDTSVANQREYDIPTNCSQIKRVTYDGRHLERITMRQEDAYEGNDTSSRATGTPHSYYTWGSHIYLYPTPSADGDTIEIFTIDLHAALTLASTSLSIPAEWHTRLANYVIAQVYLKDQDNRAGYYIDRWEKVDKPWIIHAWRKKVTRDKMRKVLPMRMLPQSEWGNI